MTIVDDAVLILKKIETLQGHELSAIVHSQSSFEEHLLGTYRLLSAWGESHDVCVAGLCHSVYGTEIFQSQFVTLAQRDEIREIIGLTAERLAYLFCVMSRPTLYDNLKTTKKQPQIFNLETRQFQNISPLEFSQLLTISVANIIEQRPRLPLNQQNAWQAEILESRSFVSPAVRRAIIENYRSLDPESHL